MAGNGGGERKGKEFYFFLSVFWLAKDVGLNFFSCACVVLKTWNTGMVQTKTAFISLPCYVGIKRAKVFKF